MSEPNLDERIRAVARPELAAERDALAARVKELEDRIARALDKVCVIASPNHATYEQPGDCMMLAIEARRILRGEDSSG